MGKRKITEKQAEAGRKNLAAGRLDWSSLPPEEEAAIKRKGQAAMVEAVKQRRTFQQTMREVLELSVSADMLPDELQGVAQRAAASSNGKLTVMQAQCIAQAAGAMMGSTKAAQFCRDTAGDAPVQQVQQGVTLTAEDAALMERMAGIMGVSSISGEAETEK